MKELRNLFPFFCLLPMRNRDANVKAVLWLAKRRWTKKPKNRLFWGMEVNSKLQKKNHSIFPLVFKVFNRAGNCHLIASGAKSDWLPLIYKFFYYYTTNQKFRSHFQSSENSFDHQIFSMVLHFLTKSAQEVIYYHYNDCDVIPVYFPQLSFAFVFHSSKFSLESWIRVFYYVEVFFSQLGNGLWEHLRSTNTVKMDGPSSKNGKSWADLTRKYECCFCFTFWQNKSD